MSSYSLVISPLAQGDLQHIYNYGVNIWGATQSSKYLDKIKQHFWRLTEYPETGPERKELLVGIRSYRVESHVLFYRLQKSKVEIIRVLHVRQDPRRHFWIFFALYFVCFRLSVVIIATETLNLDGIARNLEGIDW